MANIRVNKVREFTTIDNFPIIDTNLSMEALGLLVYLLSKPNDWRARKSDILKRFPKNRRFKIESAFKEFVDCGYAKLEKLRDNNGKLKGSEYIIFERPSLCQPEENITDSKNSRPREKPTPGKTDAGNSRPVVKTERTTKTKKTTKTKDLSPDGDAMTLDAFVKKQKKSTQPHIRLIGWFADKTKPTFETKSEWDQFRARHLRAASRLVSFHPDKIVQAYKYACEHYEEFSMESLLKHLTNGKNQKPKSQWEIDKEKYL